MIIDSIRNLTKFAILGPNFQTAIEYVQSVDLKSMPTGQVEIDGDRVFAVISEKDLSIETTRWEVHRLYADIQIIFEGNEVVGYFPLDQIAGDVQFPADKDIVVFDSLEGQYISLTAGQFFIALPNDIHKPNCLGRRGSLSKKIVLKVLL